MMVAISSFVLVAGEAIGEAVSMTSAQVFAAPESLGQRGNETE